MNGAESMVGNETLDRVLSVSTATRDGVVIATVEDRGPGLTQDIADRVFEPFFTTKSNGLGLGLSICRSIISSHQGRLWAANNGDRGARFMFSLPITDVTAIVEGAVRAS
jgi:C4-dicarboxylate-specific signal transduction histidine kinase